MPHVHTRLFCPDQVRLLAGATYGEYVAAQRADPRHGGDDPAPATGVTVAASSVRAGHASLASSTFATHLHLRPCLEVRHGAGRHCCDVLCAITSLDARGIARRARKGQSVDEKLAAVSRAGVSLFVQWWGVSSTLPETALPGGRLGYLTNTYSILPLDGLVVYRRVLVAPQLGSLAFLGHPNYAPVIKETLSDEAGKPVPVTRRYGVLVAEPYYCD